MSTFYIGGNLGLGTTMNVASPRQVTRMRGKGIKAVSCSEGCTAAISSDGRMYTWGSGMAGQLGHGNMFRLPEPKLLSIFGDEVVIEQVGGFFQKQAGTEREATGTM